MNLQQITEPTCRECGQPTGPDPTGSPGVVVHLDADGEQDHDLDADHVALPEIES